MAGNNNSLSINQLILKTRKPYAPVEKKFKTKKDYKRNSKHKFNFRNYENDDEYDPS